MDGTAQLGLRRAGRYIQNYKAMLEETFVELYNYNYH